MSTSTRTSLTSLSNSISSPGFRGTFLDVLSYNIVQTATSTSLLSGRHEGKHKSITKALQPLRNRPEAPPKPEVGCMVANGEWVAVQFRSKSARGLNSTDFDMQYYWLMRVANGRIMEVMGIYD